LRRGRGGPVEAGDLGLATADRGPGPAAARIRRAARAASEAAVVGLRALGCAAFAVFVGVDGDLREALPARLRLEGDLGRLALRKPTPRPADGDAVDRVGLRVGEPSLELPGETRGLGEVLALRVRAGDAAETPVERRLGREDDEAAGRTARATASRVVGGV